MVQTNLRAMQEILDVTTPARFVDLQQRFVREYMEGLLNGTLTLVQAIQETAEQARPHGI
ncbi:MAG: phasin family protein [Rhodopila sp.]